MDFASTSGSHLSFSGHNGAVTFTADGNGHDFQINNVSGGTGSAMNLFGTIGGSFTIGTIVGSDAPVSGSGVLTIFDGSKNLTADIGLVGVEQTNSFGMINLDAVVNLSNVSYAGSNADLRTFANDLDRTILLGFFDGLTLSQLKSGGVQVNTAFSGSLMSSAPEPGTMTLFLLPAIGGLWFARRRGKAAGASHPAA